MALAHVPQTVTGTMTLHTDRQFECIVNCDIVAFVLDNPSPLVADDAMKALLDGPADQLDKLLVVANARFRDGFTVECMGSSASVEGVIFPDAADLERRWTVEAPSSLPIIWQLVVKGRLPEQATAAAFQFPKELGPVLLTVNRPAQEPVTLLADAGELTDPIPVQFKVGSSSPGLSAHGFPISLRCFFIVVGFLIFLVLIWRRHV